MCARSPGWTRQINRDLNDMCQTEYQLYLNTSRQIRFDVGGDRQRLLRWWGVGYCFVVSLKTITTNLVCEGIRRIFNVRMYIKFDPLSGNTLIREVAKQNERIIIIGSTLDIQDITKLIED